MIELTPKFSFAKYKDTVHLHVHLAPQRCRYRHRTRLSDANKKLESCGALTTPHAERRDYLFTKRRPNRLHYHYKHSLIKAPYTSALAENSAWSNTNHMYMPSYLTPAAALACVPFGIEEVRVALDCRALFPSHSSSPASSLDLATLRVSHAYGQTLHYTAAAFS